jgi:integrase
VRRTVSLVRGHGYVETEPKTARGKRRIALPQPVLEVLKQHRAHQLEIRLKAGANWHDLDLVFCNIYGGFLHPDRMVERFQKLLKDSGLHHMRFHDLRHSAATIMLTMDIYSHVLPSMQRDAMDKWLIQPHQMHGSLEEKCPRFA